MSKKILHVLQSSHFSGAENVACQIIKMFEDSADYEMAYASRDGQIRESLKEKNIKFYPMKKLCRKELKRVIDEYKPDIIHAHDNRTSIISSLFSRKCTIISHIHGNNKIMNSFNLKSFLFNICSKRFKRIIWVSESSLNDYYFKNNVIDKSVVQYNVINSDEIIKKSNLYEYGKEYDLIYIGRLAYPKNPERLIEIMRLLKEKNENINMAIVGDGVDRPKIEELINKYKLNNNITLYGFQKNPYPILKNSKILIMTSIYEGTPMIALEAQALGKPIVATPVDGLKKIIINEENGYLSDDNNDIAQKIIQFLNNQDEYNKLAKDSFNIFKTKNNIKKYFEKIKIIYEE